MLRAIRLRCFVQPCYFLCRHIYAYMLAIHATSCLLLPYYAALRRLHAALMP